MRWRWWCGWPAAGRNDAGEGVGDRPRAGRALATTPQGAVFAVVKTVVDRGGATAVRSLTGTWPG
ncbi:DUF4235 domain-containing protein [Streptomyces sp.]|uniref:DUF4235 domain-containing protein n=1 Tax=Streptomyces sp. TaxID=1931 RepID=UPI0039C938B7